MITHNKSTHTYLIQLLLYLLITALFITKVVSQASHPIKGVVIDSIHQTTLPYVTIFSLKSGRGVITNEKGVFSIDISGITPNDTISFRFIGYKTKHLTYNELKTNTTILLSEDVMPIDEIMLTNKNLNAERIVKNILKNLETNYQTNFYKSQVFARERYTTEVEKIELDYKKSTIQELTEETLEDFEKKTPKNSTSYFDFISNFYVDQRKTKLKLEPLKSVELISKDLAELENYRSLIENLITNTKEKEYWKLKSGLFGKTLDIHQGGPKKEKNSENRPLEYLKYQIKEKLKYATLEDTHLWDFLHATSRYNFELKGSTFENGESVYIISFSPKKKGLFEGELFITTDTNALLKGTYTLKIEKNGKNFNFLGLGYKEIGFKGSIYFQKHEDYYQLKYFSYNKNYVLKIDRKIALQKKKERFLFDKTIKEIKLKLDLRLNINESIEYFSIKSESISRDKFENFKENEFFKVIDINQFDENLWKGYDIIEPTKRIREYQKLE